MGMIGTLIGLVQMLSAMDDPKAIGPAMAVAVANINPKAKTVKKINVLRE